MTTDKNAYTYLNSSEGCVIMASGEGRRFGGNKLMANFNGRPLVAHIIGTAQKIFENVVVVTRHKDVEQLCQLCNVPVVCHNLLHRNDTVRLGLEYLGRNFDGYIFCQGDQPLLSETTLQNMINEFEKDKKKIIRLQYDDVPCSPVIFPQWAYDSLANLPQGKGGNVVAKSNLNKVVYVTAKNRYETVDVDTKEDLEKLAEYIYKTKITD